MGKCSVFGCKNYPGKKNEKSCRFFRFPKNEHISKKWVNACGNPKDINLKNAFICSEHFTEQDWKLEHILLNIADNKKRLKEGALPTKNLPNEMEPSEREKRLEERKRKQIVEEAILCYDRMLEAEISVNFESINHIENENIKLKARKKKSSYAESISSSTEEVFADSFSVFPKSELNENEQNNHEFNFKDCMNLCHICGKSDEEDEDILVRNEEADLFEIINTFFSISIDYYDEITWKICGSCKEFLLGLSKFSIHVQKVQKMFLEIEELSKSHNKFNLSELRLKYGINKNFKIENYYIEGEQAGNMQISKNIIENTTEICQHFELEDEKTEQNLENSSSYLTINSIEIYDPNTEEKIEFDEFQDMPGEGMIEERTKPEMRLENIQQQEIHNNNNLNEFAIVPNLDRKWKKTLKQNNEIYANEVKKKFKCNICFIKLFNKADLLKHLIKMHNKPLQKKRKISIRRTGIYCEVCRCVFNRTFKLERHLKEAHNIIRDIPPCEHCGKKFSTSLNLKYHQRIHLPPEEKEKLLIPCPFCDQKFSKRCSMKTHVVGRHSNERNYVCEICGKQFSSSGNLSSHRQRQHIETRASCSVCKKICKNQTILRSHMLSHRPPSIPCSTCGALLKNRSVLKNHMLLHSDISAYKCSFCGKDFKRKITFQLHMIIHTGLKPFICRFCGEGFANPGNCKKHEKRSHKEQFKAAEMHNSISYQNKLPTVEQLETIIEEIKSKKV